MAMNRFLLASALLGMFVPGAGAQAQALAVQAAPVGYAGELLAYADDSVTLKDKDGKEVVLAMTRGWTVSRPRRLPAAAVKPGDFVASANKAIDEHSGQAVELRIMEPGYRPEYGTHIMAQGGNAMTHGTVSATRRSAAGIELDVGYPGGARRLLLPGDMSVTDYEPLDRAVLRPGTRVSAVVRKGEDGVARAGRLTLNPQDHTEGK